MAKGKPGADSSNLVTHKIGGKDLIQLATDQFGETPVLWGRYFTSSSSAGNVEYRHAQENSILRTKNIRVLPIARQTKRVNGTEAQGTADATANVDDLIATFGTDYLASQGNQFLVFLDVEGDPSLSAAYFTGWAQALVDHSSKTTKDKVTFLP